MIMQRNDLKYYFRENSIILEYHNQYINFNSFGLQNKKPFKTFSKTLMESQPTEYANINDIYGLAIQCRVNVISGHKPTIVDTIAF